MNAPYNGLHWKISIGSENIIIIICFGKQIIHDNKTCWETGKLLVIHILWSYILCHNSGCVKWVIGKCLFWGSRVWRDVLELNGHNEDMLLNYIFGKLQIVWYWTYQLAALLNCFMDMFWHLLQLVKVCRRLWSGWIQKKKSSGVTSGLCLRKVDSGMTVVCFVYPAV